MTEANLDLARRGYDYWSNGDIEGMLDLATPDIEFVPAIAAGVEGGSVQGPDAFRRFFAELAETWETFLIKVEEYREFGDSVMTVGRLTAKGRGSALELDQPWYTVLTVREGKIARMESFLDRDAAEERARSEAGS
jgi:ketosteroid isomerase-like protein